MSVPFISEAVKCSLHSVSPPCLFNFAQDYISPNKCLRARRTLNVTLYECTFWFLTLGQVCLFHFLCFSAEVVRLDRSLLLFHQLCKLQKLRGHQTDDEQLHVSVQHCVVMHAMICVCVNGFYSNTC